MLSTTICVSFAITFFYALWAGSYCKKILLPTIGFVALTALSIVAMLISYGQLGKVVTEERGLYAVAMLGMSLHPLILLFFVRGKAWHGIYLTLFALINTLINLYIHTNVYLDLLLRMGQSISYALYTPLILAVWMGLMTVRDGFPLKAIIGTYIAAATATYLPIVVFVTWGSYPDFRATDVRSQLPFLFVGFILLLIGTVLVYQKLCTRKQAKT